MFIKSYVVLAWYFYLFLLVFKKDNIGTNFSVGYLNI